VWGIAAVLLASCGTEPDIERLEDGLYVTDYDPPPVTRVLSGCDRMLARVFLVISSRGSFEFRGFPEWRVLRRWKRTDVSGQHRSACVLRIHRGEYIRLLLPSALELAGSELEVGVGPGSDF
jgi:hypothetical protein